MAALSVLVDLDGEEGCHVGDARRLLHVVGHDDDRVLALEIVHEVLDRASVAIGSSAEAGSSIRMTSGSTASARAMQSRCCWPPESPSALSLSRSLTSSQSAALRSALLDAVVEAVLQPEDPRPEGDVVVDRLGERVGLLEHHPDAAAHLDRVDVARVEILAVVRDRSRDPGDRDEVVHPVEAADERATCRSRTGR